MAEPEVTVVVPNLDGGSMLLDALRSASADFVERIVVDNGSFDGSPDAAECLGTDVRVIRAGHNLGFAAACDRGAAEARGSFLLFLNNDARLAEGALQRLLLEARGDPQTAAWQPLVVGRDGNIESAGGMMTRLGFMWTVREAGTIPGSNSVFATIGPCVLVRRDVFATLGGFDPSMFAYFEEVDFCWRARLAGYEIRVVPSARVHHLGGMTTSKTLRADQIYYLGYRNRLFSILANSSLRTLARLLPGHIVACVAIAVGFLLNRRLSPAFAILRALAWPAVNSRAVRSRRTEAARLRVYDDRVVLRRDLVVRLTPPRALQLFRGNLRRW